MKLSQQLLTMLADGQFHSGTALGHATGCSRSAVWKAIQRLQSDGREIFSVRGKGYRLSEPVELLDAERILFSLDAMACKGLKKLDVCYEVDSTNAYLLEVAKHGGKSGHVCLAEQQTAGRGRRGRTWVSPFGGNLYMSLLWQFSEGASQLAGLSLAVGVAITRALREVGLENIGLKWPNDVLVGNRKLAGILLEVVGETAGPCSVVIGVGVNIRASAEEMASIDQPWITLESALGQSVERNQLASRLINHLLESVRKFEELGFEYFLEEWQASDVYAGQEVVLHLPNGQAQGMVRGVDSTGALLLARDGKVYRYYSGEVSMRVAG